jgi:hypothetical protein
MKRLSHCAEPDDLGAAVSHGPLITLRSDSAFGSAKGVPCCRRL